MVAASGTTQRLASTFDRGQVFQVSRTASGPSGSATAAAAGAAAGSAADIGVRRAAGRADRGRTEEVVVPLNSARACGGAWRWLCRSRSPVASSCAPDFLSYVDTRKTSRDE